MTEEKQTKAKKSKKTADEANAKAIKAPKKAAPEAEAKTEKAASKKATKAQKEGVVENEIAAEKPAKKEAKKDKAAKKNDAPKKSSGKLLADATLYDVIDRPLITEKSTAALEHNKVIFRVRRDATKQRIKLAVEGLFGVTVTSVNTIRIQGKNKRFRGFAGKRQDYKKAVVTLKQGDQIDFAAGV